MTSAILVLRRDDAFSTALRNAGFTVENLQLIRTRPADDQSALEALGERLDTYDGLFFTSPAAAEVVLEELPDRFANYAGHIYVLGSRAAKLFELAGIEIRYMPGANTASDMIDGFGDEEFAGRRLCFVRGDHTVGTIGERLAGKAELDEAIVYQTVETPPDPATMDSLKERLQTGDIGWACFFSPSGVETFCRIFSVERGFKAAAIGATTAQTAGQMGLDVAFVSPQASTETFAASFIEHLKSIE
jgi:uroporphyrinogen-III synthase